MFCVDSNKAPWRVAAFIIINFRLDNRNKLAVEICSKRKRRTFQNKPFYCAFRDKDNYGSR